MGNLLILNDGLTYVNKNSIIKAYLDYYRKANQDVFRVIAILSDSQKAFWEFRDQHSAINFIENVLS